MLSRDDDCKSERHADNCVVSALSIEFRYRLWVQIFGQWFAGMNYGDRRVDSRIYFC